MMALMIATDNIAHQRLLGLIDEIEENNATLQGAIPVWRELGIPVRPAIKKLMEREGIPYEELPTKIK